MRLSLFPIALLAGFPGFLPAQNQAPSLSNLTAAADWDALTLTVTYDVSDAENDPLEISIAVSSTGGDLYPPAAQGVSSGDVGYPVTPGTGKTIVYDLTPFASNAGPFAVRVVADDLQPFDLQALVDQVDSNRLRNDLTFVQGIRHRTAGAAHLAEVQDSLHNCFAAAGLYTAEQTFNYQSYTGRNIYGTQRGTVAANQVVIVDAHYDSVEDAPGADDNGSGTVGVMEIARLLSQYPTKKTVRFIGFDLEEPGLIGSLRYVQTGIPAGEQILGVFNFEMIGYYSETPNSQQLPAGFNVLFPAAYNEVANNEFRGDFLTNVGNLDSSPLGVGFKDAAAQYVPDLKVISIYAPGNSEIAPDLRRSDHARFWDAGVPALMLTDGANFRNLAYHTPGDTLDILDFTFMSNVVKATLAAAADLAEIQHGDWQAVPFQGSVGTKDPDGRCDFTVSAHRNGSLYVAAQDCAFRDARVEVFDAKGSLLYSQIADLADDPSQPELLHLPAPLNPGMYLVTISHESGSATQKVVVR